MDEILKVGDIKLEGDPVKGQEGEKTTEKVQDVQEGVQDEGQQKEEERELSVRHEEPQVNGGEGEVQAQDFEVQCDKDEYLVKTIDWKGKKIRIITQNENGPCPLVAISNVLFLRGDLEIQPADREVVNFDYLVDRLGDYLLNHAPAEEQETSSSRIEHLMNYRHNLDTALSILPNLKTGLDVNVQFDSIHGFEPTAELAMFDLFNVDLVHGWVADPQDIETFDIVVNKCKSYNQTVEFIVQANEISSRIRQEPFTLAEEEKLHEGYIATEFLNNTATQLTYFGLELLLDSIPVDTLCVLFRNNHFSTVYRHPQSGLYMLVTDSGLVLERTIIWESITDVDQGSSGFFNGNFETPRSPKKDVNTDLE
ncbi:hypothetical protein INT47_008869 [Mucor saturninus]|uniref:MINDY deubiquitinase domain-containing protein n=1 Tax=Mucor saturninus TaxID=64648 RepID=A0A8H7R191_9FUNG|nr:hypothetical protein INT47_008869 [Mucor saturninus]